MSYIKTENQEADVSTKLCHASAVWMLVQHMRQLQKITKQVRPKNGK